MSSHHRNHRAFITPLLVAWLLVSGLTLVAQQAESKAASPITEAPPKSNDAADDSEAKLKHHGPGKRKPRTYKALETISHDSRPPRLPKQERCSA